MCSSGLSEGILLPNFLLFRPGLVRLNKHMTPPGILSETDTNFVGMMDAPSKYGGTFSLVRSTTGIGVTLYGRYSSRSYLSEYIALIAVLCRNHDSMGP